MLIGVLMKAEDTVEQAIRLASDIGLRSASRRMRLAADMNKQMVTLAFSEELNEAMAQAGTGPKVVLDEHVLFLSDNSVSGQLPYRISFFSKETFTPLGHTYYATPQDAVRHLKELEVQAAGDSEAVKDFIKTIPIDGIEVTSITETATKVVVGLTEKDQHRLAVKLQQVLEI